MPQTNLPPNNINNNNNNQQNNNHINANSNNQQHQQQLHEKLEQILSRLGAIKVNNIFDHLSLWPDSKRSFLGKGSFGAAHLVREKSQQQQSSSSSSSSSPQAPIRVAKELDKKALCQRISLVRRFCAEYAALRFLNHHRLNRSFGLYHSSRHIYIVLEYCGGPKPDIVTRVASIFARANLRDGAYWFPQIDSIIQEWTKMANEERRRIDVGNNNTNIDENLLNENDENFDLLLNDFVDRTGLIDQLAARCGVNLNYDKAEIPTSGELTDFIVATRGVSHAFTEVVTRHMLEGLDYLHNVAKIVHRDLKPPNVVVGVSRKAVLKRDPRTNVCLGATFYEKIDTKIIDFGLAKYLEIENSTLSPTMFNDAVMQSLSSSSSSMVLPPNNTNNNSVSYRAGTATTTRTMTANEDDHDDEEEDYEEVEEDPRQQLVKQWEESSKQGMVPVQSQTAPLPPDATNTNNNKNTDIQVSWVGTEWSMAIEGLNAMIDIDLRKTNQQQATSSSTTSIFKAKKLNVPKLDTFSVGVCLYCCLEDKPPFGFPPSGLEALERRQHVRNLVAQGPQYYEMSSMARDLCSKLLENDVSKRLTVREALNHPFFVAECQLIQEPEAVNEKLRDAKMVVPTKRNRSSVVVYECCLDDNPNTAAYMPQIHRVHRPGTEEEFNLAMNWKNKTSTTMKEPSRNISSSPSAAVTSSVRRESHVQEQKLLNKKSPSSASSHQRASHVVATSSKSKNSIRGDNNNNEVLQTIRDYVSNIASTTTITTVEDAAVLLDVSPGSVLKGKTNDQNKTDHESFADIARDDDQEQHIARELKRRKFLAAATSSASAASASANTVINDESSSENNNSSVIQESQVARYYYNHNLDDDEHDEDKDNKNNREYRNGNDEDDYDDEDGDLVLMVERNAFDE